MTMKVEITTRRRLLGFGQIAYGWQLRDAAGRIVGRDAGEGFATEDAAIQSLRVLRHPNKGFSCAPIFNSHGRKVERWATEKPSLKTVRTEETAA